MMSKWSDHHVVLHVLFIDFKQVFDNMLIKDIK